MSNLCLSRFKHNPGPLAKVLEEWVDERYGPIKYVVGFSGKPPEPPWWVYDCRLSRPLGEGYIDAPTIAMGASIDGSEALVKALGEAVERYNSLNSFHYAKTIMEPLKNNPIADMLPICAAFENCRPSFKSIPRDVPVSQSPARSFLDDSEIWLPSGHVHLNFEPGPGEPLLTLNISSGLAFHSDLTKALWSGILEYAERDAIMTSWLLNKQPKRILFDIDNVPDALAERLVRLKRAGLEPCLFDVSTDFRIPAVFCILRSDTVRPYATVGGCCNPDPVTACIKAIDETMCIRSIQKEHGKKRDFPSLEEFGWVETLLDRAELYAGWKDSPALDRLTKNNPNTTTLDEISQQDWWDAPADMNGLRLFAQKMHNIGLYPVWSDITMDDVRELGYVTKVTVPQMIPLSPSHSAQWLASPRLLKAAGKDFLTPDMVNPYPHPMA